VAQLKPAWSITMTIRNLLAALLAGLAFAGCATVNVSSDGADDQLMLRGYDPVAYQTQNRAIKGDAAIKATHAGLTYRFATADNRALFNANPAKYVPAYGGFCSNGAPYAIKAGGNPENFKVVDGRLFIFGDGKARDYWELDQARNIVLGDQYWENEMKDAYWRTQSYKRWIFKVPHYKTGPQLEAELQAKKAGK
jgi:YHS domain-containing protein